MTPTDRDASASRRQLLLTGSLGAAATAFLAACGTKDNSKSGQSGVDPTTTLVTPTVPLGEPSEVELATEQQNLRTAASLELVVAAAYTTYGPKLTDAELSAQAERIAGEHTELADTFNGAVDGADQKVTDPNEWVQTNVIDPVADQMTSDGAILSLMGKLESTLAASYTQVVSDATTTEWRGRWAAIAAGAARRAALLSNGGDGAVPTSALYPSTDAVSNNAKLVSDAEAEGDGGS
ncbi:MAG TPA: hypothetical protein P5254_08370 [Aquihabitans sp.]|nr:hypothetical protein [Aquihabitans sp.]